ncbi:MAG: hypothetical protein NTY41_15530 [Proteobacteria bacterium]|nr:hypothetical protein [Pseudomonadota bacterium]
MVAVAVLVCLFAIGMAALLNYFKYRSTADRLITARLIVIGKGIENSIQASLALGLSFNELTTLPSLIERERQADPLIREIKVFDPKGRPIYGTNAQGMTEVAHASWLAAAKRAGDFNWSVIDGDNSAVGISIKNNFGLIVGYLALNYSRTSIDRDAHAVAQELALPALGIFAAAAALTALMLNLVMLGQERDMRVIELALQQAGSAAPGAEIKTGPFGSALVKFFDAVRTAEVQIAELRGRFGREARS